MGRWKGLEAGRLGGLEVREQRRRGGERSCIGAGRRGGGTWLSEEVLLGREI